MPDPIGDPHAIVAAGYDAIAARYDAETVATRTADTYYRRFLDRCLPLIPEGGTVLDLGCGSGLVGAELAGRAQMVGVDISRTQLVLARIRVPGGRFVQADMTELSFTSGAFDAIAAFWSIIHVRRDLHAGLLREMRTWLRPGGVLFGTYGGDDNPDEREPDFFGAPMYWSHYGLDANRRLLVDAGYTVELAEVVEDMGESPMWMVATA